VGVATPAGLGGWEQGSPVGPILTDVSRVTSQDFRASSQELPSAVTGTDQLSGADVVPDAGAESMPTPRTTVTVPSAPSTLFADAMDRSAGSDEPTWPRKILFVGSSGGHLSQLAQLRPWWQDRDRKWVTFPGQDVDSLLAGEDVTTCYHPTTRNAKNAVRNMGLAVQVLRDYRPDVVVSAGAGVAVPFFIGARALGIRTVYLEVYDRIDLPTVTGKLCYPFTDLFLLQWQEQLVNYPKGVVVGSLY
jgi:beta-1,4-N-acetylglucosaminyltransferase